MFLLDMCEKSSIAEIVFAASTNELPVFVVGVFLVHPYLFN